MIKRGQRHLSDHWWVSISPRDAVYAATHPRWQPSELEFAAEPDNHPHPTRLGEDLDGGPKYGKRPDPRGGSGRVPAPFLSYARAVTLPRTWAGQTLFLHLDNVRYHVTVTINGRRVARYVGGLEPHRFDVTKFITPGELAVLLITVGDSSTSGHRRFDAVNFTGTRLPTCKEIENNLVHPVVYGGSDRAVGKVSLEAVPPVRVEFVFANPKVARGVLEYTVALRNDTARPARVRVRSDAVGAKKLVDEAVTIPARRTQSFTRIVPWADPILWDTDNPHLYDLKTALTAAGKTLDVQTDYFGFREFTINGHSFFLNGKKIHLHGQSNHTSPDRDQYLPLKDKMHILRGWKEQGHVNHLRLHARPQDKGWVEAADRVGMLLTTETALWTTGFWSFDWVGSERACSANVRQHFLEALVRRDRNNPSVVIWSLSNEMSPITRFDMELPKMAALTRVFEKIIAAAERVDDSRVIQMSSAMDFVGRLKLYNLHYPKNWQAYPDYPPTAYWLDSAFLFRWYGPRRFELPAWSWRKDKPLYFGEFTCVFGATPDSQANIVGDTAFEQADFGTALVREKLWPMEINAYRRQDVSGFCAWAAMTFASVKQMRAALRAPSVRAHSHALRPIAVLNHSYRTRYFAADEIAVELSLHNDTRHPLALDLRVEVRDGPQLIGVETWPATVYGPAENQAFTSRCRAPAATQVKQLSYRVTLRAAGQVADRWEKTFTITPRAVAEPFPADCGVYDPDGTIALLFKKRGITGARFIAELKNLDAWRSIWISRGVRPDDWQQAQPALDAFVRGGGCVVLDNPPAFTWAELPVPLLNDKGYTDDERLEITYAYNIAPQHPLVAGLADADFSLWGADYYVARRCFTTPQEGNAIPLLVAGSDRNGLTASPLLELRQGAGSYVVSTLELLPKLLEEPQALELLYRLARYQPAPPTGAVGVCVTPDTLRMLREVGFDGPNADVTAALRARVALVDGARLEDAAVLVAPLAHGATIYLHDLGPEKTRAVLAALGLPGEVRPGAAAAREFDICRHAHPLANGLTNNYLYWIVNKAQVAAWTLAPLHPEPASALICGGGVALTRRGAVVAFAIGRGTLVVDNLRWQLPDFDEPERPRRFVMTLLTNLGVPFAPGAIKRASQEFESEAERRERGHF